MASLWEMMGGGNFRDLSGQEDPKLGFGDVLAQNRNSLALLGMGIASGGFAGGMEGLYKGAQTDATNAYRRQQMKQHQDDLAFRQGEAKRRADEWRQTFNRSGESPFSKVAQDLGLRPGTPEYLEAAKSYHAPKTEGNLPLQASQRRAIAEQQGLDLNDPQVRNWVAGGGTLSTEGKPLPAELAGRVAMGGKFLDEAPNIRKQIEGGITSDTVEGRIKTYFQAGEQGNITRAMSSGTDALLRHLTGAGMSLPEAQKYVKRYEIEPTDQKATQLDKFDRLHDELNRIEEETYRGRGGIPKSTLERRRAIQGAAPPPDATAGRAPGAGPTATPVRVNSPEEARKLKSGTRIILPDGSLGKVP